MADRFDQFRLSLIMRTEQDLFEPEGEKEISREAYLRQVFAVEYNFEFKARTYWYIPYKRDLAPGFIMGGIGRKREATEEEPTEEGFIEQTHDSWKSSLFVLDPHDRADYSDGQRAALKAEFLVGSPATLIELLVKAINEANPTALYTIEAQPIFDGASFWDFARENAGAVTSITFDLLVPNGFWNVDKKIDEELREIRRDLKAKRVVQTVKSDEGLNTNDPKIKEAVDYAGAGGGSIRAEARPKKGGKKRFNSKNKTKATYLEDEVAEDAEPLAVRVAHVIGKILGRE